MAKSLFENTDFWENYDGGNDLTDKIIFLESLIRKDVKSIIDVGCGNGIITNHLNKSYTTLGVDSSEIALKYLDGPTMQCQINDLKVESASFDLVLCSEVLEHLPDAILKTSVEELKRVSKKYVLITVPYDEYLPQTFVKCPKCNDVFHAYGHLQTFKEADISRLIGPEFQLIESFIEGPIKQKYNPFLLKIRHKVGKRFFNPPNEYSYCESCSNTHIPLKRGNIVSKSCNLINRIIGHKNNYWMFTLYRKN